MNQSENSVPSLGQLSKDVAQVSALFRSEKLFSELNPKHPFSSRFLAIRAMEADRKTLLNTPASEKRDILLKDIDSYLNYTDEQTICERLDSLERTVRSHEKYQDSLRQQIDTLEKSVAEKQEYIRKVQILLRKYQISCGNLVRAMGWIVDSLTTVIGVSKHHQYYIEVLHSVQDVVLSDESNMIRDNSFVEA